MSMWQSVSNTGKKIGGYNHWPNPFNHMVRDLDVLACEDTFQAKVQMFGGQFGQWFFSAFIPGPREIERKTLTGSYKCGFFFGIKFKSPIDIIWQDAGTGTMLMEIARPFVTALFYIWAAETIFDAVSRWQSVMYAMERCDKDSTETLLRDAHSPMTAGHHEGGAAFAQTIWDPNHWGIEEDCSVNIPFAWPYSAWAAGYIVAEGKTITNIRIQMTNGETVLEETSLGNMNPGDVKPWSIGGGGMGPGAVQPRIICDVSAGGVIPADFKCVRLSSRQGTAINPQNHDSGAQPDPPCDLTPSGIPLPG